MQSILMRSGDPDAGLLFLRIGVGLPLSLVHGWQKLADAGGFIFAGHPWGFVGLVRSLGFPVPVFFAICAALGESVCALSVSCGLFTRVTAGAVTATMAVAMYGCFKSGTPVESAYLFAIPFAVLTVTGPGKFSLDRFIQRSSAVSDFPVAKG
jgi:putative oxidoreductase